MRKQYTYEFCQKKLGKYFEQIQDTRSSVKENLNEMDFANVHARAEMEEEVAEIVSILNKLESELEYYRFR